MNKMYFNHPFLQNVAVGVAEVMPGMFVRTAQVNQIKSMRTLPVRFETRTQARLCDGV